jgi:TolB-like protein/Tfp pilus assembly protein PilF
VLEDASSPRTSSDARKKTVESIAVLPLANASRDPEAEYLSDGVTETLIGLLSRLPGLRVIARSVAARYRGDGVDPLAAGRALGVGAVLAGRILARGDQLVVNVELIEVSDGSRLWGERLSHRLADILDVEETIARQIAERLKLKLTGEEDLRLAQRGTGSGEAYREYLKGRFQWAKRTDEACRRAIEHYQRAIEIDPEYALAYGGIADSHNIQGFMCNAAPRDAFPRARASARRALELNPGLVEAKASLGYVTHYLDWDFAKAEAEYRAAISERGDYATVHLYLSNVLTSAGRFEEALEEQRRALELEPLALIFNAAVGWTLYHAGRFEESVAQLRRTLDLDAGFVPALLFLGAVCTEIPREREAVDALRRAVEASGGASLCRAFLAHAHAAAGDREEAARLLRELAGTNDRYVPSYDLAAVHAALGERDDAFRRLERAFEERSHRLTFLRVDPRFRGLRSEERFEDLARRVGIPRPA